MKAYRTKAEVTEDGKLYLTGLPFTSGVEVEVIVSEIEQTLDKYPLRGSLIEYQLPFDDAISSEDWEATQ